MKHLLRAPQPTWHQGTRRPSLAPRSKRGHQGPEDLGLRFKVTQLQKAEPGCELTDRQRTHSTK